MNKCIALSFFLLYTMHAISQNPKIDSLKNALNHAKEDSNKVILVNALINELSYVGKKQMPWNLKILATKAEILKIFLVTVGRPGGGLRLAKELRFEFYLNPLSLRSLKISLLVHLE